MHDRCTHSAHWREGRGDREIGQFLRRGFASFRERANQLNQPLDRSLFFHRGFRAQKRVILSSRASGRSGAFRENFFRKKGAMGRNSIDNCSLGLLIALAAAVVIGFNWNTRVTTKFGDIKGLWSRSTRGRLVAHYLGIPYAQPPLGDLRFRVSLLYSFFFFFLLAQREFLEKYFRGSWFVVEADFVKCLSYYIFIRFSCIFLFFFRTIIG